VIGLSFEEESQVSHLDQITKADRLHWFLE
jgi:hypothetical protein